MGRDEEVQYEQDHLGNENKKIDTLRAQEGNSADGTSGITTINSEDTGSVILIQEKPDHADQMIIQQLTAHNSASTGAGTFSLYEAKTDDAGNITDHTRRSVPISVGSASTRIEDYTGEPFDDSIAVESDFSGYVGVGFISDHKEYNEPDSEDY